MTADGAMDTSGADTGAPVNTGGESTGGEGFSVPEAYADKAWAQNVKSYDDLFSQFDNVQGMIGKKSVPAADATIEQMEDFFSQLRPESADAYNLSLPEGVEAQINEEMQGQYKQLFHKLGIHPTVANALYQEAIKMEMAGKPTEEQLDQEFNAMLEKKFGSKEAGDKAVKTTLQYALEHSKDTRDLLSQLPNEQLMAFVEVVNSMHSKMPAKTEDSAPQKGGGEPAHTMSLEEKVAEANKIRRSAEIKDPFNPENAKLRERLKVLDAEIQKGYNN